MLCCSDFRGADRARACPGPGKRLSHCPANLGPTGTPPPRGQLDGWMDGWVDRCMDGKARGGMLRSKSGPCHPCQHPPGLEALHTLRGGEYCLVIWNADLRERHRTVTMAWAAGRHEEVSHHALLADGIPLSHFLLGA